MTAVLGKTTGRLACRRDGESRQACALSPSARLPGTAWRARPMRASAGPPRTNGPKAPCPVRPAPGLLRGEPRQAGPGVARAGWRGCGLAAGGFGYAGRAGRKRRRGAAQRVRARGAPAQQGGGRMQALRQYLGLALVLLGLALAAPTARAERFPSPSRSSHLLPDGGAAVLHRQRGAVAGAAMVGRRGAVLRHLGAAVVPTGRSRGRAGNDTRHPVSLLAYGTDAGFVSIT